MSILDVEHHCHNKNNGCDSTTFESMSSIEWDDSDSDSVSFFSCDTSYGRNYNSSYSSLQSHQTFNSSKCTTLRDREETSAKVDLLDAYFGRNRRNGRKNDGQNTTPHHEQALCTSSPSECRSNRTGVTRRSRAPRRTKSCPDGLHFLLQNEARRSCRTLPAEDVKTVASNNISVSTWHHSTFEQHKRNAGSFRRPRPLRRTESVPNNIAGRARHHNDPHGRKIENHDPMADFDNEELESSFGDIVPTSTHSLHSAAGRRNATPHRSTSDVNKLASSARSFARTTNRGPSRAPGRSRSDPESLLGIAGSFESRRGVELGTVSSNQEESWADNNCMATAERQNRRKNLVRRRSRTTRRWKSSPNLVKDDDTESKACLGKGEECTACTKNEDVFERRLQSSSEHSHQHVGDLIQLMSPKHRERHHDILTGYSRYPEKQTTTTVDETKAGTTDRKVTKNRGNKSIDTLYGPSNHQDRHGFRLSRSSSDSQIRLAGGNSCVDEDAKREGILKWWRRQWIQGMMRSTRVASRTDAIVD